MKKSQYALKLIHAELAEQRKLAEETNSLVRGLQIAFIEYIQHQDGKFKRLEKEVQQ